MLFDIVVVSVALWASFALRFDRWTMPANLDTWLILLSAPAIAVPIFIRMGLYRAVVRYLPERALWTMLQAVTLAVVLWVLVAFLSQMTGRGIVPRSVPIIYWALVSIAVIGSRFAAKWLFWPISRKLILQRPAVVIYGAGEAGTQLAMSLRATHFIAGFIDDDTGLHRREVAGIRVYPRSQLSNLVQDFGVKQVILSMPSLSASRRKEIVASVSGHGVKVQSLPGITDLVTGKYLVSQIREIEIDDLLGRSSVPPDLGLIREMIVGRTVMVTGAGGSIGSELCRKIAQWSPQRLVLFEANEFALYQIDKELAGRNDAATIAVLGSVTDRARVRHAIIHHGVDVVFHAAAHKHVPLVEANVLEGIQNNVFGTKTVVDAAFDAGVKSFVLISTDKAVRPTNVMGGTKRWAELIVREKAAEAARTGTSQRFCAVRFGNVLGSNGSVVPLFKEQIARGGPLTLTDPGMTRYFMSIHEAAELIVQAGALSEGGDVFLLDMGQPMLISDLAENMIRLAGLTVRSETQPDGDIEIVATGKRPGEKMYEELFYDAATARPTRHPKILRAAPASDDSSLGSALHELSLALAQENELAARNILFGLIVETDHAGRT
ncbi:NDP-sugar epimerase, includes UDP-GlcNAc-inverting 4,6-dehydratase FlaA1 and capsular polysaccharide biosynthesis protein EpsC [Devosia limi DSM 17137]|uniref:NDP-sugar epimerase, includes UDP-GlcNAc-inverting 4,6-dehydratase FlaA1 and capsular polysaccharide biosynthesis protein EpsC n=1 Tax=Devosia limi DSM 17137 TaxID=1121477 RepID=A0A1M5AL33_9HYPH|nr:NDP-sugar epimerase, includes UDP-GlcNAc-inverting 4,6-dehydratase FlaA1 and capsular polysaccharide biosynthesis protein EpsC [Devosia limi DSM 17137]